MVSSHKIEPETKALVRLLRVDGGLSIRQIVDRCKISRASVYRCLNGRNCRKNGKSRGRPRLITGRQQRVLDRNVHKLRKEEGNFSCHRLPAESGLQHVSLWTVNRTLKRMGYNLQEARKKGILTSRDQQERVQFARRVKKTYPADFFQREICFFLDGVSFYHKRNPLNDARAPQGKVWRKRNEGLVLTAKGSHVGSGGKVVKMLVAISYGKGVIYCEQYDKLDGDYIAQFVRRKYRVMFRKSGKEPSRLFIHDNCPILNCSKARKAVREVGGRLFAIPKRSPDLNPIENIFNIVKRDLKKQALTNRISSETFQEFACRVKRTLYRTRKDIIDNTIASMYMRLDLIIASRGRRTNY